LAKGGTALPDAVNKENVAFAQKNETALMALMAVIQKLRKPSARTPVVAVRVHRAGAVLYSPHSVLTRAPGA